MTLTRDHIANSIHSQLGFPKNKSAHLVNSLLEIIKSSLENGEDILISGFGKFCVKEKKERKGRNPQTRQDLILKPRKVITFRCSGVLKDKINGKG